MARLPLITPPTIPTATISRCLVFPDSLEWKAIINGFISMGTDIRNWQQQEGGITPEEAVGACVDILYKFFENNDCSGGGNSLFVGEMKFVAFETAPEGWLLCHGQELSAEAYPELFAAIGYGFGGSDGTFVLPDLKGRSPMGAGTPSALNFPVNRPFGTKQGFQVVTLQATQMPIHEHGGRNGSSFLVSDPSGAINNVRGSTNIAWHTEQLTASAGQGMPHENQSPVTVGNFIIYTGQVA